MSDKTRKWEEMICQCGQKMDAVITGYLPVPEGHYVGEQIFLSCPACQKHKVWHFYAGGPFALEDFQKLRLPRKIKDKANQALHQIYNMIWGYKNVNQCPQIIAQTEEALKNLVKEDYPLLYAELAFCADGEMGKVHFPSGEKVIDFVVELIRQVERRL